MISEASTFKVADKIEDGKLHRSRIGVFYVPETVWSREGGVH